MTCSRANFIFTFSCRCVSFCLYVNVLVCAFQPAVGPCVKRKPSGTEHDEVTLFPLGKHILLWQVKTVCVCVP